MRIAIVTDSTAYLTDAQYQKLNVRKVPLSCVFDSEVYKEEVDITTEEFFLKVREVKELPTSSQPTIGDFTAVYQELGKTHDAIISIHLSSKISGTFQNAYSVAQSLEDVAVYPYDSGIAAAGQAFFVIEAAKMAQQGKSAEAILACLDQMKEAMDAYFVVDDVTNLVKGGRLSRTKGNLATLLKIKPVLTFEDGEIVLFDKIRTKKKALRRIEEVFEEAVEQAEVPLQATVLHAYSEKAGREFKERLENKFPNIRFHFSFFGPVIGVHVGEGALGVVWTVDTDRM